MKITVKNMVCDRCKSVLRSEFAKAGIPAKEITLGEIQFSENYNNQLPRIKEILVANGFEMVENKEAVLVANVKRSLVAKLNADKAIKGTLSEFISSRLNKEYSLISKVFSNHEGVTIEKYFIRLKIEKVKELIQMKDRTFSEIAYELDYTSSSHLAKQFKAITGISMGAYQKMEHWNRKPLDQII